MKILYDWQAFNRKFSGVSKCFVELMTNLPEGTEYEISLKYSENEHLLSKNARTVNTNIKDMRNFISEKDFFLKRKIYKSFAKLFPRRTSEGVNYYYSIERLKSGGFDIFHPTFYNEYFLKYLGNKPFVLTVHDMIPESFPELFKHDSQARKKSHLVKLASHIVAVSQNTKNDLMRFLDVPEEKITVIYHGAPEDVDFPKQPRLGFQYLLFVGERGRYKNFCPMLVNIADFLKQSHIKLVCTHNDFDKSEKELIHKLQLDDYVVHVFVNDVELKNLYCNAFAFVQPSLYEGFGIPILEAYQCGCPVFLNNKSVFPEIAGDAAVFFELDNEQQNLSEKLEAFLSYTDAQKNALIEKQQKRLEFFSWKKSAEKLNEVYLSVLK